MDLIWQVQHSGVDPNERACITRSSFGNAGRQAPLSGASLLSIDARIIRNMRKCNIMKLAMFAKLRCSHGMLVVSPTARGCFGSVIEGLIVVPGRLKIVALLVHVLDPSEIMPEMTGSVSLPGNSQCPNTVSSHVRGKPLSAVSSNTASSSGVGGPTRGIHLPTLSGPRAQVQLTWVLDRNVIPRSGRMNANDWSGWTTLISDRVFSGSELRGCVTGWDAKRSCALSGLCPSNGLVPVWNS